MPRLRPRPFSRQEHALGHSLKHNPKHGLHYGRIGHHVRSGYSSESEIFFFLDANREEGSIETLTFQTQDNCGGAVGVMGPTTSNSTTHSLHDQVETPDLRNAKPSGGHGQVETPSPHKTTPNGKNDQVETPNKEIQEFWLRLLSSDRQQKETESKKYEAVLRIQCKVRQIQAAMKYLDARTEKRSMSCLLYTSPSPRD